MLRGASSGMYTCTGVNQLGMGNQTITITIVGQRECMAVMLVTIGLIAAFGQYALANNRLVIGYFYDLPVFEYKVCNFILTEGALCKLLVCCVTPPPLHTQPQPPPGI